jgi:serine/threonine-protein kinase
MESRIELMKEPDSAVPAQAILEQLQRIAASATFQQVDRLKHFLEFIVLEATAGRGNQLKEYVIGVQVFDKDSSFDPRTDPIVRVQARRLRARLARYYQEEGAHDRVQIDLPKGGYAPVFRSHEAAPQKRSIAGALASRNTVAVLPFADQSPEGNLGYFCAGLAQQIVHTLISSEIMRVVAAEQGPHDRANGDLRETAARLDAAMLICGSVRKSAQTLRVMAQIVDGPSGTYLWSESLDGSVESELPLQDSVARAILAKLKAASGRGKSLTRRIENLAARNLYLQGRYHMNQRTEEGLRKAVEFFERALIEDGQYAAAFSGLADAYGLLGHYGVLAPAEVWTKTASSAASAVMLDDASAEAHASLAHVKSTQDWDWSGAEREFQRAIRLNNAYPTARHWYAISCLAPMARLDEALEEMLTAEALDPVSSIIARDLAMVHYYRRDFETALDRIDHTVELNPHFSPAYWALGQIQEQRGELDEATAAFERALQLSPESPKMQSGLARSFAVAGKPKHAQRILRQMHELAERRYVSPFELASVHFALGETETGFEWLTKAFQDRCFELLLIEVDPRFDSFRRESRFNTLSKQLGLPSKSAAAQSPQR